MTYDRSTIAAYVDGELNLVEAKRIENAIGSDRELAKAIEQERALRARLTRHFDPILDERVPDRLTTLLSDNAESLNYRRSARTSRWLRPSAIQWAAMAASLVVGIKLGGTAMTRDPGYVRDQGGQIVASGELADALNTQLASTQGSNPVIRIGTSFAAKDGGYCRTFGSAVLDGIACTEGNDWKLRQTLSGDAASEYRQASAGALAEAAATMMSHEPLDAAGEAAVMKRGWR
ncbi:anti-sigma factor family protein [Sphingorhabdus sp.]|uniref:anti-sigma factor family protein n=1 Tax=Sphingorhabdus sp. TaxID=1902408 RepID=UPI00391D087B